MAQLAFTLICSVAGLGFAIYLAKWVLQNDEGTKEMQSISNAIREGAEAFLARQYKTIAMLTIPVAVVIYLLVYAFMNLGAFAVIIAMRRRDLIGDEIDDLSGLMARAPGMAVLMLIFLLSLAGIPPTAGFIGKYYIFLSLIQTGHYYLAVLAVGYAVVALYYYFRIVVVMFMKKAPDAVPLAIGPGLKVALAVSVSATLVIGIYPEPFILWAQQAIRPFSP